MSPAAPGDIRQCVLECLASTKVPSSVYRLQMNAGMTFSEAARLVPYLVGLGIDGLYTSPYFQVVRGSEHGYNVTDPNRLNPELGTTEDHADFCSTIAGHGMLHVIDIVPNHMGIDESNGLWMDVLKNGSRSAYRHFFDIDWNPGKPQLQDKVLLPVLGGLYGKVLERAELRLEFDAGRIQLRYFNQAFPIAPHTYPLLLDDCVADLRAAEDLPSPPVMELVVLVAGFRSLQASDTAEAFPGETASAKEAVLTHRLADLCAKHPAIDSAIRRYVDLWNGEEGVAGSFDRLHDLLELQAYRLAYWRVASDEINYRRFFNIHELVAVRMEDPRVFHHCHELVLNLLATGKVHGLRIDHPDGLYDPEGYFEQLQRQFVIAFVKQRLKTDDISESTVAGILADPELRQRKALPIVVEKILKIGERLPSDWQVHGTVGYEYMAALDGLFVRSENECLLTRVYETFIEHRIDTDELVRNARASFSTVHMASELQALGNLLDEISETSRYHRDFTRNELTRALRAIVANFPVYRTYVRPGDAAISESDRRTFQQAIAQARRQTAGIDAELYSFLEDIFLMRLPASPERSAQYLEFILRFQQFTAPIMAKGLEDTAFYVNNRLLPLNEVGNDPARFGRSPQCFHQENQYRLKHWPYSFTTVSTHDTKRSHDTRMRLAVLSELPEEWATRIADWSYSNAQFKTEVEGIQQPKRNAEYYFYQTLLGAWPDALACDADRDAFVARIEGHMIKAVREARIYTNWAISGSPPSQLMAIIDRRNCLMGFTVYANRKEYAQGYRGLPSSEK